MAGHAKTLNPRQAAFAQLIATGTPLTEAYSAAGYSANPRDASKTASRIAKQPLVIAEVERLRARTLAKREMSAERWRNELTALFEQDAAGSRVGDHANALRNLELWGRHLGILEPRTDDQAERVRQLTDNLALLAGFQLAQQAAARQLPETATVTVEAQVRDTMALAPASEEPRAREGDADPALLCQQCGGNVLRVGGDLRCIRCARGRKGDTTG